MGFRGPCGCPRHFTDPRNRGVPAKCRAADDAEFSNLLRRCGIEADVTERGQSGGGMACRELVDVLDDYLGAELSLDVRSRFETHLVKCRDCLAYLRGYRDTVRLLHETRGDLVADPPAEVPPELLDAIRAARQRRS